MHVLLLDDALFEARTCCKQQDNFQKNILYNEMYNQTKFLAMNIHSYDTDNEQLFSQWFPPMSYLTQSTALNRPRLPNNHHKGTPWLYRRHTSNMVCNINECIVTAKLHSETREGDKQDKNTLQQVIEY